MPRAVLGFLLLAAVGGPPDARGGDASGFKVVVHASNSLTTMAAADLGQLFLKRTTRWAGGATVVPVDQPTSSAARDAFSRQVLGKPVVAMEAYWAKQLFSGQGTPPLIKPSDREVIAYVRDNPGAVGYVAADAPVEAGTKALTVTGVK